MQILTSTQAYMSCWTRCWGKPLYGPTGDTSGWLTSPDGKQFRWYNSPVAKEFYNDFYRPMINAKAHPRPEDEIEGGLFAAGRCAIVAGYEANLSRYTKQIGENWKYYENDYVRRGGREGRIGTASEWKVRCISSKTKYPEEALLLAGDICSTDAAVWDILVSGAGRAGTKGAFTHPKVLERYGVYKDTDRLLTEKITEPYPIPWNMLDYEFTSMWKNLSDPLMLGEKDWEQQSPIVQKEIQALFDQPRP